jgi:hypothetical protein
VFKSGRSTLLVATLGLAVGSLAQADGIDEFNNSWTGQALAAQRLLDLEAPLADSNILGAHNSFNSAAYTSATAYFDPNQLDSTFNQLRMGVRAIELDVHWTPKTEGPLSFPNRLLQCHGTAAHLGCSLDDRYLTEGLDEVAAWLNSAASQDQVLILHLEDHMEGQHAEAYSQVSSRIGSRVYASGGCGDIPSDLTKADVLSAGKNVLVWNEGGCSGDANWNATVFTGLGGLTRVWEDSTAFGGAGASISAADVVNYFANGMNLVDLDQLHQNDSRWAAAVWSWDNNEPNNFGGNEDCAEQQGNGRWNDANCNDAYVFACEHANSGGWAVSSVVDAWGAGALACDGLGAEYQFSVPTNSQDNQALKLAKEAAGQSEVWLNHDDRSVEGLWRINNSGDVFYGAGALTLLAGQAAAAKTRLLKLELNCNLVLYSVRNGVPGGGLWTSDTANAGSNCRMDFQADGNLVVYDGSGQALWASGSSGTLGAEFHLQADGNAVVYNGAGAALWQTYTNYAAEYSLGAGQFLLLPGQIVHSQNRKLEMQSDCNLVLSSFENGAAGGALWRSDTSGAGENCYADFQADGNFVVYDGSGQALWASGTSGTSGGELRLQDDGNLVVYNGAGQPLWTANASIPEQLVFSAGSFLLAAGQFVQDQNRKLEMQSDCDLVLSSVSNAVVGSALWRSQTSGAGSNCFVDFQADGNFVVYDGSGQALWASGTSGTNGGELRLQVDGNLVVYNGAGQPLWAANSNITSEWIFQAGNFLLGTGQFVHSQNRSLDMQSDCNLVLHNVTNALAGAALWHSESSGSGSNCYADFQADGNLVVYDGSGQPQWASGTSGTPGAQLRLQADGNMVIYNVSGAPLWASYTAGAFQGASVCGDLICNGSETCSTCPGDCGTCLPVCGDFVCSGAENCSTCSSDCGACGGGGPFCGDLACNGSETCSSCAGDCGTCLPVCGDLSCTGGETCSTCADDCGACASPVCGDFSCNGSENCSTCPSDCGVCAAPVCGDLSCNGLETCSSCPGDCGSCAVGNEVPTLSRWGVVVFVLLLVLAACFSMRVRRQS